MSEVSIVTFNYVLDLLEKKSQISKKKMLEVAKVTLEKDQKFIDSRKLSFIFKYIIETTGDKTLALKIGSSTPYQSLGLLGYMLVNSNSVEEMIERFNKYQTLIGGYLKFHFLDDSKYFKISIYINENPLIPVSSFHAEVHLSAILSIINQISGKKIYPSFCNFTFKKPDSLAEYKALFGENLFFEKESNSIYFLKQKLQTPIENSDPKILTFFQNEVEKILQTKQDSSYFFRVQSCIFKNIGFNEAKIDHIAKDLGLTVRTLQNYLKVEKRTFREALESVRKEVAVHFLKNTQLEYGTISSILGYSEPSSFFRAYKSWFHKTPKEERLNLSRV